MSFQQSNSYFGVTSELWEKLEWSSLQTTAGAACAIRLANFRLTIAPNSFTMVDQTLFAELLGQDMLNSEERLDSREPLHFRRTRKSCCPSSAHVVVLLLGVCLVHELQKKLGRFVHASSCSKRCIYLRRK